MNCTVLGCVCVYVTALYWVDRELTHAHTFYSVFLKQYFLFLQAVTRKKFQYPDDTRKSLENGVLLCE